MSFLKHTSRPSVHRAVALGTAVLLCGCQHLAYRGEPQTAAGPTAGLQKTAALGPAAEINPPTPFIFPGQVPPAEIGTQSVPPAAPPSKPEDRGDVGSFGTIPHATFRLNVGDTVTVTFTDLPPTHHLPERKERIREDGKLTLYYGVTVQAAGKTAAELQDTIQKEYVPRYYHYLTVTVKAEEKVFYVDGEVKAPNRYPYAGNLTVLRAIAASGGFTDFASRKKIEVQRAGGKKVKVNWYQAIKDPSKDPIVYPDDTIIVHKKLW
jgi:polysaccharide export outer membrane protein